MNEGLFHRALLRVTVDRRGLLDSAVYMHAELHRSPEPLLMRLLSHAYTYEYDQTRQKYLNVINNTSNDEKLNNTFSSRYSSIQNSMTELC